MAKETKTGTSKNRTISVKGTDIALFSPTNTDDYISLTDIAKYRDAKNPGSSAAQKNRRGRNPLRFQAARNVSVRLQMNIYACKRA
jgi:hypothetical protein